MIGAYLEANRRSSDDALARAAGLIDDRSTVGVAMRYAIDGGGKRLRPALCSASYEAVARAEAGEQVADLGCAVELIHTYSLVHDDLPCMDDDNVRRGRPTTHRVYGEGVAILAGAALIPLAFRVADQAAVTLCLEDAERRGIALALAHAAGAAGMVGGQLMDLQGDTSTVDLERLKAIHAAKTGALLRAACRIGAIAAHASEVQLVALDTAGRHLGLAFQITDDVLDETASTEELGKTAGKDRDVAKATYPALLGVAGAAARAEDEVRAGIEALRSADLATATLAGLCRFAVERKR